MGQQTTESLRQSGDGFLSIPEIITNKQIAKAGMYLKVSTVDPFCIYFVIHKIVFKKIISF